LRVTVPDEFAEPRTEVGVRTSPLRVAALTVSVVVRLEVIVPVKVTVVSVLTAVVLTLNVAEVWPPDTVTEDGTVAAGLLEDRVIAIPEVGAAVPRVTVPTAPTVPMTLPGATLIAVISGGVIVKLAVFEMPAKVPVMVAVTDEFTELVLIVKVAEDVPAEMFTVGGVNAEVLLEPSATLKPPAPAFPARVAVPVADAPPRTEVGLTLMV